MVGMTVYKVSPSCLLLHFCQCSVAYVSKPKMIVANEYYHVLDSVIIELAISQDTWKEIWEAC